MSVIADPIESTQVAPLLYRVEEAGAMLHVSRSRVFELINSGVLPSVKLGRSRRIRHDDLVRFVEALR